jgi:hypothetical protein
MSGKKGAMIFLTGGKEKPQPKATDESKEDL